MNTTKLLRGLPPLAALVYPGLIWCGAVLTPLFLLLSLAVPVAALWVAHRTGQSLLYRRSRSIAFFAVGAPPLYTFLGGWLDFQDGVPFKGLHVWIVLWAVLACIAIWERPSEGSNTQGAANRRLAFAHGISAALITCFAVAHLINHLGGLWGADVHIAIMEALRPVYRNPFSETVLLASVAFQLVSGFVLLRRKMARAGGWVDSLQAGSGAYLLLFFLSHLSAVLRARFLSNKDPNWIWLTGSNLLTDLWSARLTPYYFLAIIALGIHGAAGIRTILMNHRQSAQTANTAFFASAAAATVVAVAIMSGLIQASMH